MRIGSRIFLCYVIITLVCFSYPIYWVRDNLRTRYLESVEDPLVDQANIMAAQVGLQMEAGSFEPENWYRIFEVVSSHHLQARIYDLEKTSVDLRVYMTDAAGKIIFDSQDRQNIGSDYAGWRDVALTLKGQYGARSTHMDKEDPSSAVLYVAAPIMANGSIAGVLTAAKPTTNINSFLQRVNSQLVKVGLLSALLAIFLCTITAGWIALPVKRLTQYAHKIRQGQRVPFPKLDSSEIGQMGKAFEKMQEVLEGKKYVEQYVQNLTHEIKSPLSAIRGAAELMQEQMPPEKRARFLANIRGETNRIQQIIDRMLKLAELENRKGLKKIERVSFTNVMQAVLESKRPILSRQKLTVNVQSKGDIMVRGDSFLLYQAVSNLIQNAIEFSPPYARIDLTLKQSVDQLIFSVADSGPGIPKFALEKVFDKFFSLQRPESGKKSTGLGLNFTREVAILHNGAVTLQNRSGKGALATLIIPI